MRIMIVVGLLALSILACNGGEEIPVQQEPKVVINIDAAKPLEFYGEVTYEDADGKVYSSSIDNRLTPKQLYFSDNVYKGRFCLGYDEEGCLVLRVYKSGDVVFEDLNPSCEPCIDFDLR